MNDITYQMNSLLKLPLSLCGGLYIGRGLQHSACKKIIKIGLELTLSNQQKQVNVIATILKATAAPRW